jgi:leader peptidase (prepilin peptidase)/N-methyltransferase
MSFIFIADHAMLIMLLVFLFIFGTMTGSLLNVCVYRLPLEKSIIWPGSHCGKCLQPIRWYDNIPLVSYLVLRGRCRRCGATFSSRYFLIELLTGLIFAGLFYLVVDVNIHDFPVLARQQGVMQRMLLPTWEAWAIWGHHTLLVCFLIVAFFCDLDHREIPLGITVPGAVLGLVAATVLPWPWPLTPAAAVARMPPGDPWWIVDPALGPKLGAYPWPFWGPLPGLFAPGGNWQTGLATGLAGALGGTLLLRVVRFLFGVGMGIEALGLGDADLMMMAGGFLGWQPVVVAFVAGVLIGLVFGLAQLALRGDNSMPFGPSLAVGTVVVMLCWRWVYAPTQAIFFNLPLLVGLGIVCCILMLGLSRLFRRAHR